MTGRGGGKLHTLQPTCMGSLSQRRVLNKTPAKAAVPSAHRHPLTWLESPFFSPQFRPGESAQFLQAQFPQTPGDRPRKWYYRVWTHRNTLQKGLRVGVSKFKEHK